MAYTRDSADNNDFEKHEIKTFQRKGDQVRSEYERLNPDGTVTKTIAYGDIKEGLRYRTFQMYQDGSIRETAPEQPVPKAVPPPPPQRQPQPQPAPQEQPPPRRRITFVVEPKSRPAPAQEQTHDQNTTISWRFRPVSISQEAKKPEPPPQKGLAPWWFEPLKEALDSSFKEHEKPKPAPPLELPEKKVSKKSIFDWFDDDMFFSKPSNSSFLKESRNTNPFDALEESFFGNSLFGDFFNTALLE